MPTGSTSSFTNPLGKILYSIVFLQTKRLQLGSRIGTGIHATLLILVFFLSSEVLRVSPGEVLEVEEQGKSSNPGRMSAPGGGAELG